MDAQSTGPVTDRSPANAARLWAAWTLATALGLVVAVGWVVILAGILLIEFEILFALLLGLLLGGLIVSLPQYLVLRSRLRSPGGWITATALGSILALIGTTLIIALSATSRLHLDSEFAYLATSGVAFGTLLGLSQGLALRRTVRGAGWWILGSAAGWSLGVYVLFASSYGDLLYAPLDITEIGLLLRLAIAGLVVGAVTGAVLVWLLGWAPRVPEMVPASESRQPVSSGEMEVYRVPAGGFARGPSLLLWGGLLLAVLLAFGAITYFGRNAALQRSSASWEATPDPRNWAPVGYQQPEYEADYAATKSIFDRGAYSTLHQLSSGPAQPDMYSPGTQYFTARLYDESEEIWLENSWCTENESILEQNLKHMSHSIVVNGNAIPYSELHSMRYDIAPGEYAAYPQGMTCMTYGIIASNWPVGRNHVVQTFGFDQRTNDGFDNYEAGEYVYDYTLLVGP